MPPYEVNIYARSLEVDIPNIVAQNKCDRIIQASRITRGGDIDIYDLQ